MTRMNPNYDRDRSIIIMLRSGEAVEKICETFGVTRKNVETIRNHWGLDDNVMAICDQTPAINIDIVGDCDVCGRVARFNPYWRSMGVYCSVECEKYAKGYTPALGAIDVSEAYELRSEGQPWKAIGKMMHKAGGTARQAVYRYAIEHGLQWPIDAK